MLFAILVGVASSACGGQQQAAGPPPDFKFEIDVRVSLDSQKEKGVAGMPVLLDGKTIGYTDSEGKFRALLTDQKDTEVTLAIGKNPAYKFIANEKYEVTKPLKLNYNKARTGIIAEPIQLLTSVASAEVDYLVWVAADCGDLEPIKCSGLPVMVGDKQITTTDSQGRAHFVHVGTPKSMLEVKIDTMTPDIEGNSRNIEPASPTFEVELGKAPQVYTIAETFAGIEDEEPKKKTTKRRRTASRKKSSKSSSRKSTGRKKSSKSSSKKTASTKKSSSSKKSSSTKKTSGGSKEDPISLF